MPDLELGFNVFQRDRGYFEKTLIILVHLHTNLPLQTKFTKLIHGCIWQNITNSRSQPFKP